MSKNTCDGDVYIHNLTAFIKSHEQQFANALVAYKKLNSIRDKDSEKNEIENQNANTDKAETKQPLTDSGSSSSNIKTSRKIPSSNEDTTVDEETLTKEISRPARLSLSLHHLYFILGKFQELGIQVGPMNLRFDSMDSETNTNYVSFLSEFQRNKKIDSDSQSIHSISSVKSVMSSVSAIWSTFNTASKTDNTVNDLKYVYSAFSKLPCLRLANDPKTKIIEGHEEYPFETATPVIIFKNISILEISELDPKEIYGWNFLATKLRHLVIKKANIVDPADIFITLVDFDLTYRGELDGYSDTDDLVSHGNIEYETDADEKNILEDSYGYSTRLTKSKSNENKYLLESHSPYRASTMSNIPLSQSSLSLSSNTNFNQKSHVSPNLHQSPSFPNTHIHSHSLTPHNQYHYSLTNYNHNHNHNYHYGYNYHHSLSTDAGLNHSTSPSSSLSSNYYTTRLYAEDVINQASHSTNPVVPSSVHSNRRSYYYKPQNKSRRSRASTSFSNNSNNSKLSNDGLHTGLSEFAMSKADDNNHSQNSDKTDRMKSNSQRLNVDEKADTNRTCSSTKNSHSSEKKYWNLLKNLSLTENKIERISLNSFDKLTNLVLLDLSYNKLTSVPGAALDKLINLRTLNLSFNKLLTLEKFPKKLGKLTVLKLRGNKLSNLEGIDSLSSLQKIDLRQNKIYKVCDLKQLLLSNEDRVLLQAIYLTGNPIAASRGYRVELFNLFNGLDYSNSLKIDGSRPGIFESRMLLDEKTSRMRYKNYIDESIINKMTASVSNMNLSSIITHTTTKKEMSTETSSVNPKSQFSNSFLPSSKNALLESFNHPLLDHMTTSIGAGSKVSLSSNNTSNATLTSANVYEKSLSNPNSNSRTASFNNKNFPEESSGSLAAPYSSKMHHSSVTDLDYEKSKNLVKQIESAPRSDVSHIASAATSDHKMNSSITEFQPPPTPRANSSNSFGAPAKGETPRISPSSSTVSIRNPVAVSLLNTSPNDHLNTTNSIINEIILPNNKSVSHSQRASNDFSSVSSIVTNSTTAGNDSNPVARLSLASPALPVITQATTTTINVTSISNSIDARSTEGTSTPKSLLSSSDYFTSKRTSSSKTENKENKSNTAKTDDMKLSNDDFGTGLKISVL